MMVRTFCSLTLRALLLPKHLGSSVLVRGIASRHLFARCDDQLSELHKSFPHVGLRDFLS